MEYVKLQMGCMLVVLYVGFLYIRERHAYNTREREHIFECLLIAGILNIAFDGITAYTVNHLDEIPDYINGILHICFLCSLDSIAFLLFLYITNMTIGIPKRKSKRLLLGMPFLINIVVVICFIPQLEYRHGDITNYSMGISAYTCFIMAGISMIAAVAILFRFWKMLERHKRISMFTYIIIGGVVVLFQAIWPQLLISCLIPTFTIVGSYLNMENPVFTKLKNYNQKMVMGFATLVENRDDNTGGHIKRTTEYVRMLAEELGERGIYRDELTKDYRKNLVMAAPMHDVGKIAIPDAILQKPGRLTAEEYDIMKTHAERGGSIIQETFGNMDEDEYQRMAYEVARYHHEKWNGKGYPDGLSQKEIPLCARIMAVADVFDAVSAKRCYRDALPLKECFQIIEDGRGQDFEPVIVDVFLDMKDKIKEVFEKNNPEDISKKEFLEV